MHFQAQPTMQADMLDLGTHCNDQHAQPTDLPDLGMHCNDRHAQPTDQPTDRPTCQATRKTYAAKIPATNPARLKTGLDRKRSSMEMVQAFLVLSGPETGADPDRASYGTRLQKLYHPASSQAWLRQTHPGLPQSTLFEALGGLGKREVASACAIDRCASPLTGNSD